MKLNDTAICSHCVGEIVACNVVSEGYELRWVHKEGFAEACPGPGTVAEPLPDGTVLPEEFTLLVGVKPVEQMVVVQHPRLPQTASGWGWIEFSPAQAREFAANLVKHADSIDPIGGLAELPTQIRWVEARHLLANARRLMVQMRESREMALYIGHGGSFDTELRKWVERCDRAGSFEYAKTMQEMMEVFLIGVLLNRFQTTNPGLIKATAEMTGEEAREYASGKWELSFVAVPDGWRAEVKKVSE